MACYQQCALECHVRCTEVGLEGNGRKEKQNVYNQAGPRQASQLSGADGDRSEQWVEMKCTVVWLFQQGPQDKEGTAFRVKATYSGDIFFHYEK